MPVQQEAKPNAASGKATNGSAVTKRGETRKANAAAEFTARGGRDLTDAEKLQIDALRNASKACDALGDRIRNGRPVAIEVIQAAATLWSNAFGSFGV